MRHGMRTTILSVMWLMFMCSPIAAQEPSRPDKDVWSTASFATFEMINGDPEVHVGKVYVFSGSIGAVRLSGERKSFKVREHDSKPKEGLDAFAPATGARFEVLINSWYEQRASTSKGRDEIRYLAQFSNVDPDTPFQAARHDFVGVIRLFSDTFQPYVELVAIRKHEPSALGNSSRSGSVRQKAPAAASSAPTMARKPVSKSVVLAKAESQVRFAEFFKEHSIRTATDQQGVVRALKEALREMKEEIQEDRSADAVLITARKKHGFLGTPRQMAIAVEPTQHGGTLISLKIAHSFNAEPERDERWVERTDRELLGALSQALERFGVVLIRD